MIKYRKEAQGNTPMKYYVCISRLTNEESNVPYLKSNCSGYVEFKATG